jgi:hypothetical protein
MPSLCKQGPQIAFYTAELIRPDSPFAAATVEFADDAPRQSFPTESVGSPTNGCVFSPGAPMIPHLEVNGDAPVTQMWPSQRLSLCPPYLPPLHWGAVPRRPAPAAPTPGLVASSARDTLCNAAFIFVLPALFSLISCCASLRRQIARRLLLANKQHLLLPQRLAHQRRIHLADRSGADVAPPPGEAQPHPARLHATRRGCWELHLPTAAHAPPARWPTRRARSVRRSLPLRSLPWAWLRSGFPSC